MKNLKKVLALVVALTMVFTTVAFASYPDVDVEADYAGAVELLSALEILQGDENGNFNPDNTITRAEFAAVVCRALGLENSAASAKGATMFKDVAADHWASGYINLASQQGIVNGKGNGMFDPEGNVTYAEAVKMLVVAIGYEPMAATKGGWPTGYLSVANSTKMTAGVGGAADVAALRSTVAMLTANALEIPVMDQTAFGSETKYEPMDDYSNYTTLLTQQDIYVATGIIDDVDLVEGTFSVNLSESSEDFEFGYNNGVAIDTALLKPVKGIEIGASNVADYENESVDVYVKKSGRSNYEALIAVPSGIGETLVINASDLDEDKAQVYADNTVILEYFETPDADKATKIYVAANPKIIVNGVDTEGIFGEADLYDLFGEEDAVIKFIENTDDKYFDYISVTVYEHAIVDEVNAAKGRITCLDGNKVSYDLENEDLVVNFCDVDGNAIELADIKEGDVLAMVVGEIEGGMPVKAKKFQEKITVYNLGASSVTGTLNQSNEKEELIYIDGVQYEYNAKFVSEKTEKDLFNSKGEAKLGTEGVFYLGITGKIIGYAGVEGSTGNYAFILQGALSNSTWDKCWQIKLLLADGSIKTYDIDDEVEVDEEKVEYADQDFEYDEWPTELDELACDRVIDFKANSKDVITQIIYVCEDDEEATLKEGAEYKESTTKVGGKTLASDVVIFNVDVTDADDATVIGVDSLVNEGVYGGYVLAKNDEYDVFVMTSGAAKFDAEAPLYVVDSVVKSTYGEDKESSYEVSYYMDGTNEKGTAIFTADSKEFASVSLDYKSLAKGSLFVATTAADGLVDKYLVLANVNEDGDGYDMDGFEDRFAAAFGDDDDATYEYGHIIEIDSRYITVDGADEDIVVRAGSAQYYYNAVNPNKPKLESGDWAGLKIDEMGEDNKANFAFVKLYDGDVTDIITFSERVVIE